MPYGLDLDSKIDTFGSIKTTVDIPESELLEAMRHSKVKTKTEAVEIAVMDFNRRQRLAKLADGLGTFKNFMTRADLAKMRESD